MKNSFKISEFCIQILESLNPADVVYRTMSHAFTAEELIQGLKDREESSLIWASEVARVVVVFLQRRKSPKSDSAEYASIARTIDFSIFIRLLEELGADDQRVVFFNGVTNYSKPNMIDELRAQSSVGMEYACSFLNLFKKIVLQEGKSIN